MNLHRVPIAAALVLAAFAGSANAQGIVARVYGDPITTLDVQQRARLAQVADRQSISTAKALDLLIDEKIKTFEARKIGFRITEDDMDKEVVRIAAQRNLARDQFEAALRQQGLNVRALRERLRADISWNSLIRHKFQSSSPTNSEIDAEIRKREQAGGAKVTDYVLHQVVFVVAGGAAGAAQANANSARGRFNGCETGVEMLRGMRDVAVRPVVSRSTADMSKPIVDLLAKTPTGKLSVPYRTEQGIEALAVCERRDRSDLNALRQVVERELAGKKIEDRAAAYFKELRASASVTRGG